MAAGEDKFSLTDYEDLANSFHLATQFVKTLRDVPDSAKLKFYGLFKQVQSLISCNVEPFIVYWYNCHCDYKPS